MKKKPTKIKYENKAVRDTMKLLRKNKVDYVYREVNRNQIIVQAKLEGMEITFSNNLEKSKYSEPYYSVRRKINENS